MQLGAAITTLSIEDKIRETVYKLPVNINNIFIIISKFSIYTTNQQAPNNRLLFLHW